MTRAAELRHPCDYGPTQAPGLRMRVLDLKAIEYVSARDSRVAFSGGAVRAAYAFPIELFQVEGRLPLPAI